MFNAILVTHGICNNSAPKLSKTCSELQHEGAYLCVQQHAERIQAESKRSKLHVDTFSVAVTSFTCLVFLQVDAECLEAALTLVMLKHAKA
jgi:hypothetical protein